MAVFEIDQDLCIQCGACETECPNSAIIETEGMYVIQADKCDGCGTCASACPVEAPHEV